MRKLKLSERFKIPIANGSAIKFYTKSGLLLATAYNRIVIGKIGAYVEFEPEHIVKPNIHIPKHAEYKLSNLLSYYYEYRSNDESYVKLYYQRIRVSYADYIVGKWYIDPNVLKTDEFEDLLLPLYGIEEVKTKDAGLFDE